MKSFKQKYPANNAYFRKKRLNQVYADCVDLSAARIRANGTLADKPAPGGDDVGGEYAVYMMAKGLRRPAKTGFSGTFRGRVFLKTGYRYCDRNTRKTHELSAFSGFTGKMLSSQNLDAPPLTPYTSAAPWMDVILNPRWPKRPGMAEDFVRCRGAAN
jgi:hypothetical protein